MRLVIFGALADPEVRTCRSALRLILSIILVLLSVHIVQAKAGTSDTKPLELRQIPNGLLHDLVADTRLHKGLLAVSQIDLSLTRLLLDVIVAPNDFLVDSLAYQIELLETSLWSASYFHELTERNQRPIDVVY